MTDIIKIIKKNHGYARMKMLKEKGIHTRDVAKACSAGIIEKIKPGLYRLIDYPWDENESFALINQAYPNAVVCLASAADYYELTTFNPPEIYVAMPHFSSRIKMAYPPLKVYFYTEKHYQYEINTVNSYSGKFKIYSIEKTIIDLFRYRNKIGDDIFFECLKNYLKKNKNNVSRLLACAKLFGMLDKMLPLMRAMVAS